ncbi:hypothetical protein PAHAL_3G084900 [Panicum hallii]|uniref:Uncharacterized protein n=1 Tax=Panicum hallii TaxID=206008 RepID=A0A2S3H7G6_9POAL|nr:hypothetical protein PAHAL_3G084900 [Panicum hallii]
MQRTCVPKSSCKPYPLRRHRLSYLVDPFHPDPAIGTCVLLGCSSDRAQGGDIARGTWASGPGIRSPFGRPQGCERATEG